MSDAVGSFTQLKRRQLLKGVGAGWLLSVTPLAWGATPVILAVRVWPASDYTRVTLESDAPVKFTQFTVKDPERLVVDIEGVEFNKVLESLAGKVGVQDPYIRQLRAGRYKPGIVRLVMDLKTEVAPQVFTLQPVGAYGHRLVLDVYPQVPVDPLMALVDKKTEPATGEGTLKSDKDPMEIARVSSHPGEMAGPKHSEKSHDRPADLLADKSFGGGQKQEESGALTSKRRGKPVVDRLVTIMLDPGHGGEDPGAIGASGSQEKNVTLEIARRLKAKIDAEPNMRAAMTRDSDFFVALNQRVQKARRVQADLFVSIHADAWVNPEARGSSVFVLSEKRASSEAARWLAKRENDADLVGGVNVGVKDPFLARTLLDLSQTATTADSLKLASAVLQNLGHINRLHKSGVEQASFAVLKAPDIPSILIETAFISNPEEERRLNDDAYQDKMAEAILRGIRGYFTRHQGGGRPRSGA